MRHNSNDRETNVFIKAFVTNFAQVDFEYGTVAIETRPPGAKVTRNGRELGLTPLMVGNLLPGERQFTIAREDFETASITLAVNAGETNRFETNLLSRHYTIAMEAAQRNFRAERFAEAYSYAMKALEHKADDSMAKEMVRQASGLGLLARAREKGIRGDFADAIKDLKAALEALPDNEDAKTLLADYTQREADRVAAQEKRAAELAEEKRKKLEEEEAERRAKANIQQLQESFNVLVSGFEDFNKFETQLIVSRQSIGLAAAAIKGAFAGVSPQFQIIRSEQTRSDNYAVQFRQVLGLTYRDCILVAQEVRPGETRVMFRVLEYDHPPRLNLLGGIITGGVTFQGNERSAAEFTLQKAQGLILVKQKLRSALE